MQRINKHLYILVITLVFCCIKQTYSQDIINRQAKKYFTKGVFLIQKNTPSEADIKMSVENLQIAAEKDPAYAETFYYLGIAQYYNKNYTEADKNLTLYRALAGEPFAEYFLYHGMAKYRLTENLKAQEYLNQFLTTLATDKDKVKDSMARRTLQLSRQSETLMSKKLPSKKESIPNINTEMYDEYYPVLSNDRKKILFNRLETDTITGKLKNRIYIYYVDGDTVGANPRPLPINNIENREFILTSMNVTGKKILLVSKDDKGLYDVYESEWMVREFTAPRKMYSQVNSYSDDKFATYAHNDSLIYVVSNRPGGYGGYDIWKINNTHRIIYESMINLGQVINTEYDENYITNVANTNVLFFSSEGHLNLGESDIFRMRYEKGYYTRPVNLGYPINTIDNDDTFFPYPAGTMGLSVVKNSTLDIVITYLPPKAKKPGYIMEEQYLDDARLGKTTIILPLDE